MCDPVTISAAVFGTTAGAGTISTIGTIASIASTAFSVFGQIQGGIASRNQANFQAQVARNNQIIAQRRADDARTRGRIASGENDLQTRLRIGRERTIFATTGQEVDVGSALDITSDTAALGKLDSLRIINNAEREAAGFEAEGSNFASEALLQDATGRNAITASGTRAFGTLLTGIGSVNQKWYNFNRVSGAV